MRPPEARIDDLLHALVHEFVVALLNAELHADDDPLVQQNLNGIVRNLGELFDLGVPAPLELVFRRSHVEALGRRLVGASLQAGRLVALARRREIRALRLLRHLTASELQRFLAVLRSEADREAFRSADLVRLLERHGIRNVEVVSRRYERPAAAAARPAARDADDERTLERYQELAGNLQENHVHAFRGQELELDATAGVVERALQVLEAAPSELLALANYDDIDTFTVGHSVRVALLAIHVAKAAGATEDQLCLVGTAGLLHDIGKSRVPQEVLFKQGRLDADEWHAMAAHPRHGAQILLEQRHVHPSAIGAAFCHHMTPSGSGYPTPLLAFEPSSISRLVRICDVFEALTAIRPYKRALSPLHALVVMHGKRHEFDAGWLPFFVRTIGIHPIGTRVQLDTGEQALVVAQGERFDEPIVRLVSDARGAPLGDAEPRIVRIGEMQDGVARRIVASVTRQPGSLAAEDPDRIASPFDHACLARPGTPCGTARRG